MSRNKNKNILIKADPEPERTLKRKLREAKAQHSGEDLIEIFEKEEDMAAKNNNNGGDARKVLGDFLNQLLTSMEEASQFLQLEQTTLILSLN